MPLPTTPISLNKNENAAIRSGLDRILNEYPTIALTNWRSPDVLDTSLKDILQPRSFTHEDYELILSLRNRLADSAQRKRSKHSFTVIELAVLGFALRVAHKFNKLQTPTGLDNTLEIHRKRAKRRSHSCGGKSSVQARGRSVAVRFPLDPL